MIIDILIIIIIIIIIITIIIIIIEFVDMVRCAEKLLPMPFGTSKHATAR